MNITSIMNTNSVVDVPHPGYDGLTIKIAYITKETTKKLLDKATTKIFDKKSHTLVDEVDNDMFLKLYTKELIKGWSGFKVEYLAEMMPIEVEEGTEDSLVDYTEANALVLMTNSTDFDAFITGVAQDIKNFSKTVSKKKSG